MIFLEKVIFSLNFRLMILRYQSWDKLILRLIEISKRFSEPFISDLHKNPILWTHKIRFIFLNFA